MSWEYNNLDRQSSIVAMVALGLLAIFMARGEMSEGGLPGRLGEKMLMGDEMVIGMDFQEADPHAGSEGWYVPEQCQYRNGVRIACAAGETPKLPFSSERQEGFVTVQWRGRIKENEKCPLKVTLDGKTFEGADFELENFVKKGATEKKFEGVKGVEFPALMQMPVASYACPKSHVTVHCLYNLKKQLVWLMIFPSWRESRELWPEKPFEISIEEGAVMLPATYKTLVEKLGRPVKHEERRLVKAPADDDEE